MNNKDANQEENGMSVAEKLKSAQEYARKTLENLNKAFGAKQEEKHSTQEESASSCPSESKSE